MKIYAKRETAQELLGMLRNHGEQATLLSTSLERDESIIVVENIPDNIKQWMKELATRIEK